MTMPECYELHGREGCAGSHEMVTVTPIYRKQSRSTCNPTNRESTVAIRPLVDRQAQGKAAV
jgi:hypothetical protein